MISERAIPGDGVGEAAKRQEQGNRGPGRRGMDVGHDDYRGDDRG